MERNIETAEITNKTETTINIFWFRRDLRIHDNAGFYHSLKAQLPVLPLFIFDTDILSKLKNDDPRVSLIHQLITDLDQQIRPYGSSLKVMYGSPLQVFQELRKSYSVHTVFTNRDYEPKAHARDQEIDSFLKDEGISFLTFKDQIIFDKDEIVKNDGQPYTVFTPYSRKWKEKLNKQFTQAFPSEQYLSNLMPTQPFSIPSLRQIGFQEMRIAIPVFNLSDDQIKNYATTRDFPALNGTSRLSVHLRFGTISIREVTRLAIRNSEIFLNELIWRNFYMDILWHFPFVEKQSFKPNYDQIEWRNNEEEFEKWSKGHTGYPMVDAGMRELNATGYMHNRLRMITSGFLCKHLLIDWRWGEAYFSEKLLDFDLAANNGGWQWAAGSGCDAVPYFRIFNPNLQAQKFDKENVYIRRWIPDLNSPSYPTPIVEHSFARQRAISTYQKGLQA